MKEYRIGDMAIDIDALHLAKISTTEGCVITLNCMTYKVNENNMIKVISNFMNIDVESTINIEGDSSTLKVSVDDNTGKIPRTLPKPDVLKFSTTAPSFPLVISSRDKSEEVNVRVNNALTQKVVLEDTNGCMIASVTILGNRVSGFISSDACDDVKLQMLSIMMAILIMREVKLDSHYGIVGRLRDRESVIGTFGTAGVGSTKISLADLLNKAMGNKEK